MPHVKDLMTKEVLVTTSNATCLDAAVLMRKAMRGSIVVVDGEMPVGILTERDFLRKIVAEDLSSSKVYVKEIMSAPLITIGPDEALRNAARLMLQNRIRRLPVVKDNKLVGILVAADFAKQLSKKSITETILEAMARTNPYSYTWSSG